jgi:hypothetical protein
MEKLKCEKKGHATDYCYISRNQGKWARKMEAFL